MRFSDIIAGSLLMALGLVTIFVLVPGQISGSSDYGIAPDVFPLFVLWLIVIFSAMLSVSRLFRIASLERKAAMEGRDWLFLTGAAIFLLLAFVMITYLGFRWAGPVLLLAMMIVMGELPDHKIRPFVIAVPTPLILYFVFWNLFRVPLP